MKHSFRVEEAKQCLEQDSNPRDFTALYLKTTQDFRQDDDSAKISEDWCIQLVSDFFLAGAETTATTLKWAVMYMAIHQDIQKKVQVEMDHVFGKEPQEFNLSD